MRHRVTRSPGGGVPPRAPSRPFLLVVAAVAALVGLASPAAAHDTLVASDPVDGAVLSSPPAQVVLTFSGDQLAVGAAVAVTGPDGAPVTLGDPVVAGPTVTQALVADLSSGAYGAQWRSVSGDGHPIEGAFTFVVEGGPSPAPSETAAAAPAPTDASVTPVPAPAEARASSLEVPEQTAAGTAEQAGAGQWLVAGLVVLLVAGAAITVAVRRQGMPE